MIRTKRTIFIQVKGLPQGYGPFADELADVALLIPQRCLPVFERAGMPIEFIGDEMRIYLDEEILQFIHCSTNDQLRIRFSIRVSDFYFLYSPIPSSFDVTVEGGLFDTYGFHTVSEIENPPFPVEVSLKEGLIRLSALPISRGIGIEQRVCISEARPRFPSLIPTTLLIRF